MPRVKHYNSVTTTNVPADASLLQGELAVNIADQKLWVGDASGDPVELANPTITTTVTKTVGTGKDFTLFHDAMVWALKQVCTSSAYIILSLDDGTHEIGAPSTLDQEYWSYYVVTNINLKIKSANSVQANCTITLPSTDDSDQYPTIFNLWNGWLEITRVTIDPIANSYPYSNVNPIWISSGGSTVSYSVIENSAYGMYTAGSSRTLSYGNTFDTCDPAITVAQGGQTVVNTTTLSNNNLALENSSNDRGIMFVVSVTLTSNTTDYSDPLNEVQDDGGYISNRSGLIYKSATF